MKIIYHHPHHIQSLQVSMAWPISAIIAVQTNLVVINNNPYVIGTSKLSRRRHHHGSWLKIDRLVAYHSGTVYIPCLFEVKLSKEGKATI